MPYTECLGYNEKQLICINDFKLALCRILSTWILQYLTIELGKLFPRENLH